MDQLGGDWKDVGRAGGGMEAGGCLTMAPSGTASLLSSLMGPPSRSLLGSTVERAGARGRGPSPRCRLVTWASGPCTVLTCFRSELGSV